MTAFSVQSPLFPSSFPECIFEGYVIFGRKKSHIYLNETMLIKSLHASFSGFQFCSLMVSLFKGLSFTSTILRIVYLLHQEVEWHTQSISWKEVFLIVLERSIPNDLKHLPSKETKRRNGHLLTHLYVNLSYSGCKDINNKQRELKWLAQERQGASFPNNEVFSSLILFIF